MPTPLENSDKYSKSTKLTYPSQLMKTIARNSFRFLAIFLLFLEDSKILWNLSTENKPFVAASRRNKVQKVMVQVNARFLVLPDTL